MAYLLLVLTVLFWSGNFVLGRAVNDIIPPITLAFWRWAGAVLIFLPVSIKALYRQRACIKAHWKLLALLALLSVTNFNTFIYNALQSTTVTNTVLVNSFMPILIVCASWIGFGDRITGRQALGVMLSLIGLLWILSRGNPSILLQVRFSAGDLWTLAAAVSWAIYSVMLRKRPRYLDPVSFLAVLMIMGTVFLLPFYLWESWTMPRVEISPVSIASILYVAVFPSILSYLFWNRAVGLVGANRAGIFIHLMPVFSIAMAVAFLGERPHFYHLTGTVLIFSGIFLTTVERFKAPSS